MAYQAHGIAGGKGLVGNAQGQHLPFISRFADSYWRQDDTGRVWLPTHGHCTFSKLEKGSGNKERSISLATSGQPLHHPVERVSSQVALS